MTGRQSEQEMIIDLCQPFLDEASVLGGKMEKIILECQKIDARATETIMLKLISDSCQRDGISKDATDARIFAAGFAMALVVINAMQAEATVNDHSQKH